MELMNKVHMQDIYEMYVINKNGVQNSVTKHSETQEQEIGYDLILEPKPRSTYNINWSYWALAIKFNFWKDV